MTRFHPLKNSGKASDWLYANDSCEFCDCDRPLPVNPEDSGWRCPQCGNLNRNGSGRNRPVKKADMLEKV